jgi:hypothetical protein
MKSLEYVRRVSAFNQTCVPSGKEILDFEPFFVATSFDLTTESFALPEKEPHLNTTNTKKQAAIALAAM